MTRISPELDARLRASVAARYDGDEEEARQLYESVLQRIAWRARRGHKVCARCKAAKAPSAFGQDSPRPDGLSVYCRDCKKGMNAMRVMRE